MSESTNEVREAAEKALAFLEVERIGFAIQNELQAALAQQDQEGEVLDEIAEEWNGLYEEQERIGDRASVGRAKDRLEALALIRERLAAATPEPQQEEGAGLTDEERAFVLKRLKGDEYVTDTLAQKRADRTPIDPDHPGDEEAEARAAYRKAMPGVLADLDALCAHPTQQQEEEDGGAAVERLASDIAIWLGDDLLRRAGLESAPQNLWNTEKAREESAWLKGRDDTVEFVRDELEGCIRRALEEHGPATGQEEDGVGEALEHVQVARGLLRQAAPAIRGSKHPAFTPLDGALMSVLDALDELEKVPPATPPPVLSEQGEAGK